MSRRIHALAAWLGAVLAAAAQEPAAPLSTSKQQIDALRRNQAQDRPANDLGSDLRAAVPAMPSPGAGASAPTPEVRPPKREPDDAAAQRGRGWLVEGFERLDESRDGDRARDAEQATPLDPKDPDYFLKLYERQRATAQRERRQRDGAEGERMAGAPRPDAFAPFMQQWLAGSPVAGVLADNAARRSAGATVMERAPSGMRAEEAGAAPGSTDWSSRTESGTTGTGPRTATAPNPYVEALGLVRESSKGAAPAVSPPVAIGPPPLLPPSLSPKTPPERPAFRPPPSPADDRKYYPQLKKF